MPKKQETLLPSEYTMPNNGGFYLRNKERGFLGNAPVWWARGGMGYSAYIENAELFSAEEAEKIIARNPDKFEAFPSTLIKRMVHQVFDWQDVDTVRDEMEKYKNKLQVVK